MSSEVSQLKALGRTRLPESVVVEGVRYGLEKCYQHKFATAVGLYRRGEHRVVCKFHRQASFVGIPLDWLGSLMAAYEHENLRRCQGLKGVPRIRETRCAGVVAHDFVPGRSLAHHRRVSDTFFRQLFVLLDEIHDLDIAYVDLEKKDNVLVGDDGQPYLIDFQIALRVPALLLRFLPPVRWILHRLQRSDHYHVMKHFRRMRPDLLTPSQIERSKRKPWLVRLGNALVKPWRKFRHNFLRHA